MELSKIKNNNSILKNISFIFLMLIAILTLFNVKEVKAESYVADSIFEWMSRDNLSEGVHDVTVTGIDGEIVTYSIHLIVLEGNRIITSNTYYGDENDVATSNANAQNMVAVKVNGNYTINEGVTVSTYSGTYGGPKGLVLYVTDTFINRGTLSMTGKGAKAEGQNVYLTKNSNGTFEYVPAEGANGADGVYSNGADGAIGNNGTNGINRQTGGGGSGSVWYTGLASGAGGKGTSYSGGSGGGGTSRGASVSGTNGSDIGGAGGNGACNSSGNGAGGGAGNPGGTKSWDGNNGSNGTGGLLVLYSKYYYNYGTISSNGSTGGRGDGGPGGGSGAGSINIFYEEEEYDSTVEAIGGNYNLYSGAYGGNGSITRTILQSTVEIDPNKVYDSLFDFVSNNLDSNGLYSIYVKDNDDKYINYNIHAYVLDGPLSWSEDMTFGDENDIATSDEYAKNMVVVKVKGDLTIGENVTLTAIGGTYGGPKGLFLYVEGTLSNYGTITMTARGAKAMGQDVLIYKNEDGSFEYVPKKGGLGGDRVQAPGGGGKIGNPGIDGVGRQTGGGSSGSVWYDSSISGAGAAGTSYSGGTGGGGASRTGSSTHAYDGEDNGGSGGKGITGGSNDSGGGAGNPGGANGGGRNYGKYGDNGTGGLLIIGSYILDNQGTISSEGSNGGSGDGGYAGASGGGSINLFYYGLENAGNTSVVGGNSNIDNGANGGNGTVSLTRLKTEFKTISSVSINGKELTSFNPDIYEYNYELTEVSTFFDVDVVSSDDKNTITNKKNVIILPGETIHHNVIVTSMFGDVAVYTFNITNKAITGHSSKLKSISIDGYEGALVPKFHPLINEYTISVSKYKIDLDINTIKYDNSAIVEVIGNQYIHNNQGEITILVHEEHVEDTIYKIIYTKKEVNTNYEYEMTGDYQTFEAPLYGSYKVELWGASGLYSSPSGSASISYGAYTSGDVILNSGDKLYVYVGQKGDNSRINAFNGGGTRGYSSRNYGGASGGGATDVRLVPGNWDDFDSLKSRIMVAAGAGGTGGYNYSGEKCAAGGLEGYDGGWYNKDNSQYGIGGSQTSGGTVGLNTYDAYGIAYSGTFGKGGSAENYSEYSTAGGGGGGYYGGGAGGAQRSGGAGNGGGGGSSFISGHEGCDAISELSTENQIIHTGQSIHYSGYLFTNTKMIDGKGYEWTNEVGTEVVGMPTHDGTDTMVGNSGDGYARISFETSLLDEDNYLKELSNDYGTLSPSFNPIITNYTLSLGKYDYELELSGKVSSEKASVTGLGLYNISNGETSTIEIAVTAENGDVKVYSIVVNREDFSLNEHSSKLSKLIIRNASLPLNPKFHPLTYEYDITDVNNLLFFDMDYTLYDEEAKLSISGDEYMDKDNGTLYLKVTEPHVEDTTYVIHYSKIRVNENYIYTQQNNYQEFEVPITANYKVELWGASGIFSSTSLSYGAYTSGNIKLKTGDKLYLYVGQKGDNSRINAFNGGGTRGYSSRNYGGASGGGATDVRLVPGNWDDFDSLKSRIMVAAGAGGTGGYNYSGEKCAAGGLVGYDGGWYNIDNSQYGKGGTQTSGGNAGLNTYSGYGNAYAGTFGKGGSAENYSEYNTAGGGGGGYYGGGAGGAQQSGGGGNGGGGGSSFISGHEGCDAITSDSTSDNIVHTGKSVHYSGLLFTDTKMIDGKGYEWTTEASDEVVGMPTHDGTEIMTGNSGDGYAKITPLFETRSRNNYLQSLVTDKGNINPKFDPRETEYSLYLTEDDKILNIEARPYDDTASIEGIGEFSVPGGESTYEIIVTAESGDVRTYKINITREASPESRAKNITVTGLVETICEDHPGYCVQDPVFNPETNRYYMTVPGGIRDVEFTVDKMHEGETIIGDKVTRLLPGENTITIEITSEDRQHQTRYVYEIERDISDDNYLDQLHVIPINRAEEELEEIDYGFNYLLEDYSFRVDNEVEKLRIEAVADAGEEASIKEIRGNDGVLQVGLNKIEIDVEAPNKEIRTYTLNVYRVSNGNPLLSEIKVKDTNENYYEISPEFDEIWPKYTVVVENEITEVEIEAVKQADTTIVDGEGVKTLEIGNNRYTILTTAENGSVFTYEVLIIREASSNNYLSSLSVEEGNLDVEFDKENPNYRIEVDAHTKKLTINAETEDEGATIDIKNNSNFAAGENLVTIEVTAPNREKRNYYIVVTKEASDNNYLESLTLGNIEYEFNKEEPNYEINVDSSIREIEVIGTPEDENSTVNGNNTYTLVGGNNEITIEVIAENGDVRTYTVTITREKSGNAYLSAINISDGIISPAFEKDEENYIVNVENNVNSILINAIAEDSLSTVEGNGTYALEVGENDFNIEVTAENGSTKLYTVKVVRDEDENLNLKYLYVEEGSIIPPFNKNVITYNVIVPNEVTNLHLHKEAEEVREEDIEVLMPNSLVVGSNNVTVKVQNSSHTKQKTYALKVTRQADVQKDSDLKSLNVNECEINFNKDTQYYECEVENNVSSATISAEANNENAVVTGDGVNLLEEGYNLLGIRVNNDGYIKDYQIRIHRKESPEARLNSITIRNNRLNESYDPDESNYTMTTKDNNLEINYEKMHNGQEVSISGNKGLTLGENIVTIHVVAADKVHIKDYIITVTKEKNDNAYLKSLEVSDFNIRPGFNKGTYEYTLEVENEIEEVIILAEAEESTSTVSNDGMHTLLKGENEITIIVTAEDESTKEYTLRVTRLASRNNYLKSLEVEDYSITPTFEKENPNYYLTVPYETDKIIINTEVEEENALVTGDGEVDLEVGVNIKRIIVTAEHGETKVYTVRVTRETPITGLLKNIKVRNYKLSPIFESEGFNYTVVVDNEVTALDLTIEKLDPQGTYEVRGNSLEVGENEVKIISKSRDESDEREYTLTVVRQAYSNTYLSSLTLSAGTLMFEKEELTYEVEVPYETETLTVTGVPEIETSVVSGNGEYNLRVGNNPIEIKVTSEGNITRTYTVNVKRHGNNNADIETITSNLGEVTKIDEETYSLLVPYNCIEVLSKNISVKTEDANAVVLKQSKLVLSESLIYKLRVTSEDGLVVKDYVINIEIDKSTNANLSKLEISGYNLDPSFNKNVENYTLDILDTEEEIEFIAEVEDARSTILNSSLVYEMDEEEKEILITVQAEKGNVKVYKITVKKSLTRNKRLKKIEITGIEEKCPECEVEDYNEYKENYEIVVPYEVDEVGIEIEKYHENQEVKIYKYGVEVQEYPLIVGLNTYEIKVKNTFNQEITYVYNITRLKNTDTNLRSLRVTNPEIELEDFDKNKLEYYVEVPYSYQDIEVEAEAEDANADVRINGVRYLLSGEINDVTIKVTAPSGDTKEYIIHVLRRPRTNNLLKTLTVSSGDIYILEPKFEKGITDYTLELPSIIDEVQVEGLTEDEEATVEGNGIYPLKIGLNKVELTVTSVEGEEREYTVNIVRSSARNVFLESLIVRNGSISPKFEKTKGTYNVSISYLENKLDLAYVPEDPGAKVEIIDNEELEYGENLVYIKVTSADELASKMYTLKVTKGGEPYNTLLDIKVNGESIEGYEKDKNVYEITYDYLIDNALIEVTKEKESEAVSGIGNHALEAGKLNIIEIDVRAQNGDVNTYTLYIYRKKNNYLKDIVVDKGEISPEFSKTNYDYRVTVPNEEKKITIIGVKEDEEAVVTGNGSYDLNVGENIVVLGVKNTEDTRNYKITIVREASDNNYLEYLTSSGSIMSPSFEKEESEYNIKIPNTKTSLTLDYATEDEEARVEVIGNENFNAENHDVIVRVTSTSGKTRDYTLHVERLDESYFSSKLGYLAVNKGTLSPRFDKDTTEYTVTVEGSKITINAEAETEDAIVTGDGEKDLEYGRNEFHIIVEGSLGQKTDYTVVVFREEANDARLETLEIGNGTLDKPFNKNVYEYVLSISNDEMFIDITKVKTVSATARYELLDSEILFENVDNVYRIKVTAGDNVTTKTYKLIIVRTKSSNNYLRSLSTSIGTLAPIYDKNTRDYTVNVDSSVNSIIVDGQPESNVATVTGVGLYTLRNGNNYAQVIVTAENGNVRTYIVKIVKGASANNYLKKLEVKGKTLSPSFDREEPNYTLEVENDVENINIRAEAEDSKAIVSGVGIKDLSSGENVYKITVTAENNEEREYTITVTRKTQTSARIKDLWIEEGMLSPEFISTLEDYTVLIPNEYTSITEHVELEDASGTYEIVGANDLTVGSNTVKINVTSSTNEKKTYTLNVIRQSYANTYLKMLVTNKGNLDSEFSKEKQNYEVRVGSNEEKITITGIAEEATSTVIGNGEYNLEKGENKIVLTVKSETNIKRYYTVKVIREKSDNNYLESLEVVGYNLDKIFDKEEPNYEVVTNIGETEVQVIAEAEDSNSVVIGEGIYSVKLGENIIKITVTAENGETRVYTLTVTREADSNLNIESINTSQGVFEESFDNIRNTYTLDVDTGTSLIDIDVIPESNLTKVSGNKDIVVDNNKVVTITLTAENGETREVEVTLKQEDEYVNIEVDNSINLLKGEEKAIVIKNNIPEENLLISVEDTDIVTNSGLTLTGLLKGNTIVTLRLKKKPSVEKKVIVNVYSDELESDIYEIVNKESVRVSIYNNPTPRTTIDDYISGYLNEKNMIKVYTKEGILVEDYTEIIKTGMKVKLEYGNVVYDEVKVIVLGDIDENGLINVTDQTILQNHIVGISIIDDYRVYAMDLSLDDKVNVTDQVEHINYLISH